MQDLVRKKPALANKSRPSRSSAGAKSHGRPPVKRSCRAPKINLVELSDGPTILNVTGDTRIVAKIKDEEELYTI